MAVNKQNPFYVEDDRDDYSFGAKSRHNNFGSTGNHANDPFQDDDEPIDFVQIQQNSMNNQLESTQRCLASIYDSEAMGVATAEELVQQGEQLDNVEHKLDTINQDMKTTQRHLNNIKSVFGGIKNWWSGKKEAQAPEKPKRDTKLQQSLDQSESSQAQRASDREHPALRLKSDDPYGLYDERSGGRTGSERTQASAAAARSEHWQNYERKLDENLGAMSLGLDRLKNLGLGLGEEIETQNSQIERITGKAERADVTIKDQNRQMKTILGK